MTAFTSEETRAGKVPDGKKIISLVSGESVLRLYECPLSWITSETWDLLNMTRLTHDTSILPLAGGWADQPFWFVEAYRIYNNEISNHQMKQIKKKAPTMEIKHG